MRTAVLTFILLMAFPGFGHAEDRAVEDAKRFFYSGQTHYKLGEFDQALHDFQDAYRLQQDAALLFNIAQCYKQLGRLDDSLRSYRFYLRDAGAVPNRVAVEKVIAELEQKISERDRADESVKPAVLEPRVAPEPKPPVPSPVETSPVTAARVAHHARRGVLIGGGVLGAVGLGLLGGGVGTAVIASQNSDALTALDRARMPFDPSLDDSRKTNTAVSAALFSVGSAAVICAGVMIGVGRR